MDQTDFINIHLKNLTDKIGEFAKQEVLSASRNDFNSKIIEELGAKVQELEAAAVTKDQEIENYKKQLNQRDLFQQQKNKEIEGLKHDITALQEEKANLEESNKALVIQMQENVPESGNVIKLSRKRVKKEK